MIAWLEGVLVDKESNRAIVSVNGVGYEVELVMRDWYELPSAGENVTLFIQSIFKEDAAMLFGFFNKSVKNVFTILNTAKGVGPKMALQILDAYTVEELSLLIAQSNHIGLSKIKGVGPKLAKQLIIDLSGKILYQSCPEKAMQSPMSQQDAVDALVRLGYKETKARDMVQKASGFSVEDIIKSALKQEGV